MVSVLLVAGLGMTAPGRRRPHHRRSLPPPDRPGQTSRPQIGLRELLCRYTSVWYERPEHTTGSIATPSSGFDPRPGAPGFPGLGVEKARDRALGAARPDPRNGIRCPRRARGTTRPTTVSTARSAAPTQDPARPREGSGRVALAANGPYGGQEMLVGAGQIGAGDGGSGQLQDDPTIIAVQVMLSGAKSAGSSV